MNKLEIYIRENAIDYLAEELEICTVVICQRTRHPFMVVENPYASSAGACVRSFVFVNVKTGSVQLRNFTVQGRIARHARLEVSVD